MKRFQRKRTRGWKKPDNSVYVGRPTKFGNPYKLSKNLTREEAVGNFEIYLRNNTELLIAVKEELCGKDLLCWCRKDELCHADIIIKICNELRSGELKI